MALVLKYCSKTQLADAFVLKFRKSNGVERARLATWLLNRIDDSTFTDAQVQTAFGLTAGQYTTQKAAMTELRTHWLAVLAA